MKKKIITSKDLIILFKELDLSSKDAESYLNEFNNDVRNYIKNRKKLEDLIHETELNLSEFKKRAENLGYSESNHIISLIEKITTENEDSSLYEYVNKKGDTTRIKAKSRGRLPPEFADYLKKNKISRKSCLLTLDK